ncbi:MAG: DNRLRE domain-containing protein [Bacteroidales bacterium]
MKNTVRFSLVCLLGIMMAGFYACDKISVDSLKGTVEFAIVLSDEEGQKSGMMADSLPQPYKLMISVEDFTGNPVLTDKLIPLYTFGTGYVSEKIEINTGEYKLIKFMVINPAGEVVFASPLESSRLAYLVKKPLPIIFRVNADTVTKLATEVLKVGSQTPEQFGYVSFGINIISPVAFWTAAVIDNPVILTAIPPYTEAKLTVHARDGWNYTLKLFAGVNRLLVRKSDIYIFVAEKEGYPPVKMEVTLRQLLETTKENPLLLKIPNNTQYFKLVLQPGPEDGKDAMVSNLEPDKNFGDHKYFEATFLSEPVLTVMRLNRSLIFFNLNQLPKSATIRKAILKLFYEIPVPWDNNIITTSDKFIGGVFQQIVEPWDEYKVTWNNQPASTDLNQVYLPPFIRNVNFVEVDITRLLIPVSTTNLPNHGIKFKLQPEDRFPGFRFASSDHPNIALRPMLIIYYTLP